ncbi:hypothetical protein KAR91_11960 [Candidatus Pacearchaeota archaeon]|nr:hypothetical protein [Candidatus Pacearchaeota archaeon]
MATVGTRNLTLADVSRRKDPNGKIDKVVELLNETNELTTDMVVKECNDGTTNKSSVRTGLPSGTWRKLYGGIQSTKSSTQQVVDTCGMLEALPKIDCDVIDKSGDPQGALLSEHVPHLEGLAQDIETAMWYGDTALNPEQFHGLHQRYNVLSTDSTLSGYNVFNGGGSGSDNCSIWLITWGDNTVHGLYPKGSMAGLKQENLGKQLTTADDSSGDFLAYVTHYKWDIGLCVKDWRAIGRICNIDLSILEANSSPADLIALMIKCSERVKGSGRRAWYMPERVRTMLRIQMLDTTNVNLTFDTVEGKKVMSFDGTPIRVSEKLLLTEATIS